MPLSTTLSDQVIVQGPVPVSATESTAEAPGQISCVPLTVAVGGAFTLTTVAALVALHPAALLTVTV
jgi:hypothetical protein